LAEAKGSYRNEGNTTENELFFMTVCLFDHWMFVEIFRIGDVQFGDRQVPLWRGFSGAIT